MKRMIVSVSLLLLIPAFALGQAAKPPDVQNLAPKTAKRQRQSSTASKAEEEVLRVINERREAILRRDAAAWNKLMTNDFTGIPSNGQVITKAQQLEGFKSNNTQYRLMEHSEHKVRVYDNAAVVTYLSVSNLASQEPTAKSYNRWTHVLVKRNERWQIVHSQATRIEQPK